MAYAKTQREWAERAARHLKAELKRADAYDDLADKMKKHGFDQSKASIASKLSRATMSAHFFGRSGGDSGVAIILEEILANAARLHLVSLRRRLSDHLPMLWNCVAFRCKSS